MAVKFRVYPGGRFDIAGRRSRCSLGRAGIIPSIAKLEGDGATPAGVWAIRRVLYRPDRRERPDTLLAVDAIEPGDAWCDAPEDPAYNRPVRLSHAASAEKLWREDGLYDLVVVLGYNDSPPVPGKGSAIFVHLADAEFAPTRGCVGLSEPDLLRLLAKAMCGDTLTIEPAAPCRRRDADRKGLARSSRP